MSTMQNLFVFLIVTIFDFYAFIVIFRILLQFSAVTVRHPVIDFTARMTTPIVRYFQMIMPKYGRYDLAAMWLLYVVMVVKWILLSMLVSTTMISLISILIVAFADSLGMILNFLFYAIIVAVIMSWLATTHDNPLIKIINQITDPVLSPIRRIIPLVSGFDLSPLVALILLKVLNIIIVEPIRHLVY